MIRHNFIKRKIKLIQDDLGHLTKFKDLTIDEMASDPFKLATLERFLERIVMRAIDINEHLIAELGSGQEKVQSYRDTFLLLADLKVYSKSFAEKIARSAGLRNAIVHEYDNLDITLVYSSVKEALKQYVQYCCDILRFIEK